MIVVDCFKGQNIALFGLGGSGLATAKALVEGGAQLSAWDDNEQARENAREHDVPVIDLNQVDWSVFSALVLAPGVPLTHPKPHWTVEEAKRYNVEIIGDVELFIRQRNHYLEANGQDGHDCPFVAITGTNGKSTTTALIDHVLREAGCDAQMGGNIGTPILALAPFAKDRIYIIECSSFQIDLTPSMNPSVGILLNLTPDHIDRHGSFAHYCAIKERLVKQAETALVAVDDVHCQAIFEKLQKAGHKVYPVSKEKVLVQDGYFAEGTQLYSVKNGVRQQRLSLEGIASLRGGHNAQNALMALATIDRFDIGINDLYGAFASYPGLPHRMQQVRKIGHTLFINDSKATNAEASAPALATFDHIYWIIGGLAKEGGIEALKSFFPKIRKAYLIGDAAESFARTIDGAFEISMAGTLEVAVRQAAYDAAHAGDDECAVLLSPACASYDQFKNYGARGAAFVSLVNAL